MKIELKRWIIAGLFGFAFSCDTDKNIAPTQDSYFIKYYGGEGDQEGVDMVALDDGTFLLFGTTRLPGKASRLFLVKADARGNVVWEKKYGGLYDNEARDIELTKDGNIVIVGNTKTVFGDRDIKILTLTSDGEKIDSTIFSLNSASVHLDEAANSVTETSDGFIVSGYTENVDFKPSGAGPVNDKRDALFVRFNKKLSVPYSNSWRNLTGPGSFDEAAKVIEYSPERFYLFGTTNNPGLRDNNFWALGLGLGGGSSSAEVYPGLSSSNELASTAASFGDSLYVMIGSSTNGNGNSSMYVTTFRNPKGFTTASGQIQTEKAIGTNPLSGVSIFPMKTQQGFLVVGNEVSSNGDTNIYLNKLGINLTPAWTSLSFGGSCNDTAGAVAELPDGHIMITGTVRTGDECESKMALIKVNGEGKFAR